MIRRLAQRAAFVAARIQYGRHQWINSPLQKENLVKIASNWSVTFVRTHSGQSAQATVNSESQTVKACKLNSDTRRLEVQFGDRENCQYPYVLLRDNCQCEKCFHPTAGSRMVLMKDLDIHAQAKDVQIQDGGHGIVITWPDGHQSPYNGQWLQDRAFNSRAQTKRSEMYGRKHVKWGAEIKDKLKHFDFEQVMVDDCVLLDWLTQVETYGISVMVNAFDRDSWSRLCSRVGMIRRTNYGEYFEVEDNESRSELAYPGPALGLHCDLPFYGAIPGVGAISSSTGVHDYNRPVFIHYRPLVDIPFT